MYVELVDISAPFLVKVMEFINPPLTIQVRLDDSWKYSIVTARSVFKILYIYKYYIIVFICISTVCRTKVSVRLSLK